MSSLEDEILEIENYINTLQINDNTNEEINRMIQYGMSKGLIYDFSKDNYRGTMYSTKIIKKDDYDDFQNYINRCEKEEFNKYELYKKEVINSGLDYSKDELKYIKLI
jgi:2',3'-cyclic-nucleotide 2'-phosphodiesterase (5'-nucleotidase family)